MPLLPVPRAVLFDLDNTLTSRHDAVARFASRFAEDFAPRLQLRETGQIIAAIESADDNGYCPRPEFVALLRRALPWAQPPEDSSLLAYWRSVFPRCCAPRAETLRVLSWLRARGIALGLITNGAVSSQQAKIDALGIGSYFAAIVISEAVQLQKPDPRIFYLALSLLDVAPVDAWFIGDHPRNDVWGAAQTGMTSIWMPGPVGWPADVPPADLQIDDLTTIMELIAEGPAKS